MAPMTLTPDRRTTANRNVLHVETHALGGQVSGRSSPVGTPVTSGNTRWNANGGLRGAREFAALRRLLLIHAEIRTAGDDDCPFRGRRLHLRCGLWTTRLWWGPELGGCRQLGGLAGWG